MSSAGFDDEIDLRELISGLIDEWMWIVGIGIAVVAGGVLYAFMQTPSFESRFEAEQADQLQYLERLNNDIPSLRPAGLMQRYQRMLSSPDSFDAFTERHAEQFQHIEEFQPLIYFSSRFDIEPGESLIVTHRDADPERARDILNAYTDFVAEQVWAQTLAGGLSHLEARLVRFENDLETARQRAVEEARDHLLELEQALETASRLGIERPTTPHQMGGLPSESETIVYTQITNDSALPLFFQGTEILQASLDVQTEAVDRAASAETRRIEQNIALLERDIEVLQDIRRSTVDTDIHLRDEILSIVRSPRIPANPTGTGKSLILAVSIVLAGMVSIFGAVMVKVVKSVARYRSEQRAQVEH